MAVTNRRDVSCDSLLELILRKLKNSRGHHLNGYAWAILVAFVGANIAMHYYVPENAITDFFLTLPIIILMVIWSQRRYSLKRSATPLPKKPMFNQDLFLITFSFVLGCLLSFVVEYNNSDVTGWWTFIFYFFVVYGFLFSLLFSTIALVLPHPKGYTHTFALIILLFIIAAPFLPRYIPIPIIGTIDVFYAVTGLLMLGHALVFCGARLMKRYVNAV